MHRRWARVQCLAPLLGHHQHKMFLPLQNLQMRNRPHFELQFSKKTFSLSQIWLSADFAKSNLFSGETEAAIYSTSFACMPRSLSQSNLPVSIKRLHFLPNMILCVASIEVMASDNFGFKFSPVVSSPGCCLHSQRRRFD